ncbi:MAG: DUF4260 domain-containing protein [bacterium]
MVRVLLRLEGLTVCALAIYWYAVGGGSWLWFAVFFLAPDLSMLGYLAGTRIGSVMYNLVHSYLAPAALLGGAWGFQMPVLLLAGCVLAAHIGVDRLLGLGLKYPTGFKNTHLQRV